MTRKEESKNIYVMNPFACVRLAIIILTSDHLITQLYKQSLTSRSVHSDLNIGMWLQDADSSPSTTLY